jgi:hypothetical protein
LRIRIKSAYLAVLFLFLFFVQFLLWIGLEK